MLESHLRPLYQRILVDSVARFLARIKIITPNHLTLFSGFLGIIVVYLLFIGMPFYACLLMWLSGYFDTLDGTLARFSNYSTNHGAVLDIVVDRFVEFCIILGLFSIDPATRGIWCILMLGSILVCVSSFLVVGVFSENDSNKSFYYSPGLMERVEAFLFFSLMMLLPSWFVFLSIVFTLLVAWTAFLRTYQFIKQSNKLQNTVETKQTEINSAGVIE